MKVRTIAVVLGGSFVVLSAVLIRTEVFSWLTMFLFEAETHYAAGYSEKGFRNIRIGMTGEQVLAILGAPLSKDTRDRCDAWVYEPVAGKGAGPKGEQGRRYDLFGPFTRLDFDAEGRVCRVSGEYLKGQFQGLEKKEIIKKHGEPTKRYEWPYAVMWYYSSPGRSGTYKVRCVYLDEQNKVTSTEAYLFID